MLVNDLKHDIIGKKRKIKEKIARYSCTTSSTKFSCVLATRYEMTFEAFFFGAHTKHCMAVSAK